MTPNFQEVPIEELCAKVTSGATPLRNRRDYYDDGSIDWYKTGELHDWYLGPAKERITPKALEETSIKLFPANTVLMAMYGDGRTITSLGILRKAAATNQACSAMLVDEQKCNHSYFFYALKARRHILLNVAYGGAQRNLTSKLIKEFKLPIPSKAQQGQIAGILLAYDELIEINQRRIRILEEMARAIYREWFVLFRFPGHEKTKLVSSPLGNIPQGWEVKKLGELTVFLSRGLSPSYDDNGDSMVINQKCVRDQRLILEPARRQNKPIPQVKRVRFGDVLINSTGVGTLGRVAQIYQDLDECTVDTHVTIARANNETDLDFFGCTLLSQQETFDRLGVGATGQTELSRTSIANVDLVVPSTRIQRHFGETVRPLRSTAATLAKQTKNLCRTRDLLLPRLLSGQVELNVPEAISCFNGGAKTA